MGFNIQINQNDDSQFLACLYANDGDGMPLEMFDDLDSIHPVILGELFSEACEYLKLDFEDIEIRHDY